MGELLSPPVTEQMLDPLLKPLTRKQFIAISFGVCLYGVDKFLAGYPWPAWRDLDPVKDIKMNAFPKYDPYSFFIKERRLRWKHRSGNSINDINQALIEGANVFDIDATDLNDTIVGLHGIPHKFSLRRHKILAGIDLDKLTINPPKFEDLVKHISSLSTMQNPLGVSIHLKHGQFEEKTVENILDILDKYKIPAFFIPNTHGDKLKKAIAKRP